MAGNQGIDLCKSNDDMNNDGNSNEDTIPRKKLCLRTVAYNRCRKPFDQQGSCSTKSLRRASESLVSDFNKKFNINPKLSTSDRLCIACRKLMKDSLNTPLQSSQGTDSGSTGVASDLLQNIDQLDELELEGEVEVEAERDPVERLKLYEALVENMKSKFHDANTSRNEKFQILTLLPKEWSYADITSHFQVSNRMIAASKKIQAEKGLMSQPNEKGGKKLSEETEGTVINFYKSENNTYILPGLKDCVTVLDSQGNRVTEQKRLILSTLKELYVSFRSEHPEATVGFSTFAKLKPKCCQLAGSTGTHVVCVCPIHQNVKLFISGSSLPRITNGYVHRFNDYKDVLKFIVCDTDGDILDPKCYLSNCPNCPGVEKLKTYLTTIFDENEIEQITYSQWVANPQTTLKTITDHVSEFISEFCEKLEKLLPHAFIARQQATFYKNLKANLEEGQLIMNIDFAENYAFVVQNAPQGFHWNNNQSTIFVAFIYIKVGNDIKSKGLVIISDNLSHDAVAVHTYQCQLINYVNNNYRATSIDYFSDGAPQQFKNYKNILNIYHHQTDFGIPAAWHFFPTAHGKGACDGVGGSVKRAAAKASLRLPPEKQILTPVALYEWLKNKGNFTNVDFLFSSVAEYNKNVRKLKKRFLNSSRVTNLHKMHYISPMTNGNVMCKYFSDSDQSFEMKVID